MRPGLRAASAAALAVWGAAILMPPAATAQEPEGDLRRFELTRRQHAELARRSVFREAWLAADEASRARVQEQLLLWRESAAGTVAGAPPSLEALSDGLRLMSGEELENVDTLGRLAYALDLRLSPGAFEAREAGLGDALTVHVAPLYPAYAPPGEFVLRLVWIAPDTSEQVARTEPVQHTALRPPGFEMYIRAPLSDVETWRLVVELGWEGETARGVPIRVESVQRLAERLQAMDALAASGVEARLAEVMRDVDDVVRNGVRQLSGESVDGWLSLIERRPHTMAPRPEVVPNMLLGDDGPPAWELMTDDNRIDKALVLVDGASEPARAWFDNAGRATWVPAARALNARVLALRGPLDAAALQALDERFGADGIERWALVARGSAVADVLAQRRALAAHVDGLVLATELGTRRAPPPPLVVPGLILDTAAEVDDDQRIERDGAATLRWVRRRALPLVGELELPELVAEWWGADASDTPAEAAESPR